MTDSKMTDMLRSYLSGDNPSRDGDSAAQTQEAYGQFIRRKRLAGSRRRRYIWTGVAVLGACAAVLAVFVVPSSLKRGTGEAVFEAVASAGEIKEVTLPDKSTAVLNSSSRIVCPPGFGKEHRQVTLEGQAYFDVVKGNSPFVVSSQSAKVTVSGTAFDFREYPDDESASLSLLRGRVSFGSDSSSVVLRPGQSAVLRRKDGSIHLLERLVPPLWKEGVLYFDDCPLEIVCNDISRIYGTPVTISDPALRQLRFSAQLSAREYGIEEILDILSLTDKLSFRKNGNGYEVF